MKETTSFDVPVLLITFNRPGTTQKVFDKIKKLKPSKLYIFSDAPRKDNELDVQKVRQCRELLTQVNWPCQVKTKFETTNLGCGPGPASAISWVFEHEEKAIIIEDDCLPDDSFFSYCEFMLAKYEHESRIMHIAGTRWNEEYKVGSFDHFYSTIGHVWGWATWRRAWKLYDYDMSSWNKRDGRKLIKSRLKTRLEVEYWVDSLEYTCRNNPVLKHAWDYQWQYTMFKYNGLSIVPNVNLVSNIGVEGVHSTESNKDKTSFNRKTSKWLNEQKAYSHVKACSDFDLYHIRHFFMRDVKTVRKFKLLVKSFL